MQSYVMQSNGRTRSETSVNDLHIKDTRSGRFCQYYCWLTVPVPDGSLICPLSISKLTTGFLVAMYPVLLGTRIQYRHASDRKEIQLRVNYLCPILVVLMIVLRLV